MLSIIHNSFGSQLKRLLRWSRQPLKEKIHWLVEVETRCNGSWTSRRLVWCYLRCGYFVFCISSFGWIFRGFMTISLIAPLSMVCCHVFISDVPPATCSCWNSALPTLSACRNLFVATLTEVRPLYLSVPLVQNLTVQPS